MIAIEPRTRLLRPDTGQEMPGVCEAIGDIDSATAHAFSADVYRSIEASQETRVVVDCSRVTFMGSAGYHVLTAASDYATRRGQVLVIRNMSRSCALLIRACDVDGRLSIERDEPR